MNKLKIFYFLIALLSLNQLFAHIGGHEAVKSETFYLNGKAIKGHFLMTKNEKVFIKLPNGKTISEPLINFSFANQNNLSQKIAHVKQLNQEKTLAEIRPSKFRFTNVSLVLFLLSMIATVFILIQKRQGNQLSKYSTVLGSLVLFIYACKSTTTSVMPSTTINPTKTDPAFIESVFSTFKTLVKTRFDDTYFYVESEGIPSHNMMVGLNGKND